ncbi:DUF6607 family protein [Arundinibacter roseus]|uniref:YARHG domain-containing protein n=1 Tax=Arundinibacter roseus TaxID=2070510 RepID=A0A4R4KAJ8_9BACT|nr:DUF6607 family protein [Arundinibacter roseus]TDB63712.1 hypothetical protein EZE20_15555 [Arundinibacter roseus]
MKKILKLFVFVLMGTSAALAQKSADIAAIKGQCGCFDITFKYAETFAADTTYKFPERYLAKATEYVFVVEESKDKIVLQHLLAINDTMVIKHWREDWLYENSDLYSFYKDRTWKYQRLPKETVKKSWTQKVYEVNDEPRYEGSAQWSHVNGRSMWESTVDAPLPRREYTKRKDYNVMRRGNRIYITDYGYLHEQDNDKIQRNESGHDVLIAQEKGINDYRKIDPAACAATQKWWASHAPFWADVRAVWDEFFETRQDLTIKPYYRARPLSQFFTETEKKGYDSATNREKIREVLTNFIIRPEPITVGMNE